MRRCLAFLCKTELHPEFFFCSTHWRRLTWFERSSIEHKKNLEDALRYSVAFLADKDGYEVPLITSKSFWSELRDAEEIKEQSNEE